MTPVLDKFDEYLKAKNLRQSAARKKIVEEIFKIHEHFHVQDLLGKLKKYKFISRATVFRTIQLLIEAGFIRKTNDTHGHVHYEHIYGHKHHDHLVCIKCGKEIEITCQKIEKEQEEMCKKKGFTLVNHSLQIYGYCQDCQKEGK